jgi:hypothetical protein
LKDTNSKISRGHLITLVGVVSGIVLLGEGVTINKILDGVVILLGVYLARRQW